MPKLASEIGICTVEETSCAPSSAGVVSHLSWRPQEKLQKELPTDFCLSLAVFRDGVGHRRVVPCGGVEAFFIEASLLGQVICESNGTLAPEQSRSFDAQRWIFQQRPWLRETFGRRFKQIADLRIASASGVGEKNILPQTLGGGSNAVDGWSISELLSQGRSLAEEWGIASPNTEEQIRFGLFKAALDNPYDLEELSPEMRVDALRHLLFDQVLELDADQTKDSLGWYQLVSDRLAVALYKHRNDSTERFGDWLIKKSDGVIHQIAKVKRDGGTIPQPMVRECRIQMIVDAYQSMSQCIHVAMLEIRKFLPNDLTQRELEYFDVLYRRQPELGMLPLILLRDQLCNIGFDPMTIPIPIPDFSPSVFFTLLNYYSEMTRNRRAGDRGYKKNVGTSVESLKPNSLANISATTSTPSHIAEVNEELHVAAQNLSDYLGWICSCNDSTGHYLSNDEYNDHTLISVDILCQNCACHETVDITPEIQSFLHSQADVK